MRIVDDVKLDFKDVLIKPKRSELVSRKEANLKRVFKFKHSQHNWEGVPIIAANMDHTGTYDMYKAMKDYDMLTALCKFQPWNELQRFTSDNDWSHLIQTIGLEANLDEVDYDSRWICLDVANGYTERFMTFVHKLRQHEATKNKIIIAGNVCTPEATEQIILAGADIVKIGIGPGSVCTTRKMTGVGYPQLSATIECADAAHGLGGHICADGGCRHPGDVVKAFAAGADFVMLGGMFAGTDECEGEWQYKDGNKSLKFYGMSSEDAMKAHNGGVGTYRTSEGKSTSVEYKGPVMNVIQEITGGLRSACAYVGARTLKDLPKCATFVRVNRVHDINV